MFNMYIRIAQVIKSCETIPQLNAAEKYLNLWFNSLGGLEKKIYYIRQRVMLEREIKNRIKGLENA